MKKFSTDLYDRLVESAKEASEQGLTQLGENVLKIAGPISEDNLTYSHAELEEDLYNNVLKAALAYVNYYNKKEADLKQINNVVQYTCNVLASELKTELNINEILGPFEEKVPGQH